MIRRVRIAFLISLILGSVAPSVHAQDPMAKWKPSVGDKFICSVSHYSNCGDWQCGGTDTIMFQVVDTSYNVDNKHANSVFATTNPIALHYTEYVWGAGKYDSFALGNAYSDTTLLSLTGARLLETSFGTYNVKYRSWTQAPLDSVDSILFQGRDYSAEFGSNGIFVPSIGWFYSLQGYGGYCTDPCVLETWDLSLLAMTKGNGIVLSDNSINDRILTKGSTLQIVAGDISRILLTDLVGRSIHYWQLSIADSPEEIMLNVADVPNGVYFLRLEGDGVDEVKKVCIAH